jgi:hypothetical protein
MTSCTEDIWQKACQNGRFNGESELGNGCGVSGVRFLQVNPVDYKDVQRNRGGLDLKMVNHLSSFSMIRINCFGNNTYHGCL